MMSIISYSASINELTPSGSGFGLDVIVKFVGAVPAEIDVMESIFIY